MNSRPAGVDDEVIAAALDAWGIQVVAVEYQPVGYGSHHWLAVGKDGRRHFVSVDELDRKPWLGCDSEVVFDGLRRAFNTARVLHDEAKLDFVVPPERTPAGETLLRLDAAHSVAIFSFHEGATGQFGAEMSPDQMVRVARMLADLHRATPIVTSIAPPQRAEVPDRPLLEAAIADLHHPWDGGPFTETARTWLGLNANAVLELLGLLDRLAKVVAANAGPPFITHGEPHPGNLILEDDQLLLIDWDTVRLARPERDLWMLGRQTDEPIARYSETAEASIDPAALALYRLVWDLNDIAAFISLFRSAHTINSDTEVAWKCLEEMDLAPPPSW